MSTQTGWTYLDYTSYCTTTASTVLDAYGLSGTYAAESSINIAFILPRANDPTTLPGGDWGTDPSTLAELTANGTLWSTYSDTQNAYDNLRTYLSNQPLVLLGDSAGSDGYVSS